MRLLGGWAVDPLYAHAYAWTVEHRRVGALAWALGMHTDLRLLHRAAAVVGSVPAGGSVLDLPCGGGVALRGLRTAQRVRYVAADVSPAMLERTRRVAEECGVGDQVETCEADAGDLPFADGEFDLVLSLTGLHCFGDPARAVVEMVRVLRPGGAVVISSLLNDSGVQFAPVRVGGRLAGLLGPGCTGPQLLTWLRSQGVVEPTLRRSGALGYVRGVKGPPRPAA